MARLNLRVDEDLKEEATQLFKELGMDMTTAISIFLYQSVREQRIPFIPSKEPIESVLARTQALSGEGKTFDTVSDMMKELTNDED